MSLDRIWAGWRHSYVTDPKTGSDDDGCVMCRIVAADDDVAALVLERRDLTITVMNLYPYGSGHLMVAPARHVASIEDLDDEEAVALTRAQARAVRAVRTAYSPDGINFGANIGRAAGAGVPNHLHVHVLPRWAGDTNFMTAIGGARVLPESLREGYQKLQAVWPAPTETI
ncbi:MAG: HIT family protein [Actinomycetota bacterium]